MHLTACLESKNLSYCSGDLGLFCNIMLKRRWRKVVRKEKTSRCKNNVLKSVGRASLFHSFNSLSAGALHLCEKCSLSSRLKGSLVRNCHLNACRKMLYCEFLICNSVKRWDRILAWKSPDFFFFSRHLFDHGTTLRPNSLQIAFCFQMFLLLHNK